MNYVAGELPTAEFVAAERSSAKEIVASDCCDLPSPFG